MLVLFPVFVFNRHLIASLRCAEGLDKPLPYILHRKGGWMHKIIRKETIIAQFVQKDFVRGEIRNPVRPPLKGGELFHRHQ